MTPPKMISDFSQYMFKHYSQDGGKLLVHLGALGWVFSSVAQIGMLLGDKKIDKDKKKFLLPQEAADAGVNVIMYYTICDLIKKGADKLVDTGKFITDDVEKAFKEIKLPNVQINSIDDIKKIFSKEESNNYKLTKLLSKSEDLNITKTLSAQEKDAFISSSKNALNQLKEHNNNVGAIAAILQSVSACNIVTPVCRNELASAYQKRQLKKENEALKKQEVSQNTTLTTPLPVSFKSFSSVKHQGSLKI